MLLGAIGDDGRDQPGCDAHIGSFDPAGGELLRDDDLLDRLSFTAPGLGQVRLHPPALGDRDCALFARNGFERIDFRPDLAAQLLGCGVEIDLDLAHPRAGRGVEHPLCVRGRAAECRDQGERAPVVHVGVVLPGETDAAMHLDAVLRAVLGGNGCQRRGHGGRELVGGCFVVPALLGCLVQSAGGIPYGRRGPFGGGDHPGALVLDGLELADRPAELLTDLGVLRGGVSGPPGDSDSLCREQRGDDRPPGGW